MAKLKMYAILDAAAKAYGPPMVFTTNGLAIREFQAIAENSANHIKKHPADFSLWEIGEYDSEDASVLAARGLKPLAQATEFFSNETGLKAVN